MVTAALRLLLPRSTVYPEYYIMSCKHGNKEHCTAMGTRAENSPKKPND